MSRLLTRITLPEQKAWNGLLDWGYLSPEDMIRRARSYADHLRAQADVIDSAADKDFRVVVVKGAHAQRHQRTLQEPSE